MRLIKDLLEDERGTSLIEFAVVGPVLIFLTCMTADMAMGFSQKLQDQQAADQAINFASKAGLSVASPLAIQREAATAAGLPADNVTVSMWVECDGQIALSGICPNGNPERYASVRIADSFRPMFAGILPVSAIAIGGYADVRLQ